MTPDNALATLRKIINETGGNLNGVYVEQALDLEGALMFQIEIEGDASELAKGARLVWFNKDSKDLLIVGLFKEGIMNVILFSIFKKFYLVFIVIIFK